MPQSVRWLLHIAIVSLLGACKPSAPTELIIGKAKYRFPADLESNLLVDKRNPNKVTFVSFVIPRTGEGRQMPQSLHFEYDALFADGRATMLAPVGSNPRVRSMALRRPEDLIIITRPWGRILCNKTLLNEPLGFPCGMEFLEQGARWEIGFNRGRLDDDVMHEAKAILSNYRVSSVTH